MATVAKKINSIAFPLQYVFYLMQSWRAYLYRHIDGLVQDCSNSSALAMELLPSYTKPPLWRMPVLLYVGYGPGLCNMNMKCVYVLNESLYIVYHLYCIIACQENSAMLTIYLIS